MVQSEHQALKNRLYNIIFKADTPKGKLFDVILIWTILVSVAMVILESVAEYRIDYRIWFMIGEWVFTIIFLLEYLLRIYIVRRKKAYIFSFFGIIDLLSVLPTFISVLLPGAQFLMAIRILRLMRIFRVFKLSNYLAEAEILRRAMLASSRKIMVFLSAIALLVVVIGSAIYVIEGPAHGFKDIPTSIYWAVVTLTTVGYGDISPQTSVGQFFASIVMVLGYSIIAVPTGIMTVALSQTVHKARTKVIQCPSCKSDDNDADASYCKSCGEDLNAPRPGPASD
ncbi:MAG: ion transporter [Lentimicrobium sp.]|jgi:voltage-gated potassium channel|nr:ion transporter [Lentimicrobium sp.]